MMEKAQSSSYPKHSLKVGGRMRMQDKGLMAGILRILHCCKRLCWIKNSRVARLFFVWKAHWNGE